MIRDTILTIIQDFLQLICESEGETQVQNIISVQLGIKPRRTFTSKDYPNVEVDISKDNWAIEVKYNAKFYDGVDQLLAQKVLYNVENLNLIHVHKYLNPKFINGFLDLTKKLNINGFLIDLREKKIYSNFNKNDT